MNSYVRSRVEQQLQPRALDTQRYSAVDSERSIG